MTRAWIVMLALAASLPLIADEPQKTETATPAQTTTAASAPVADSPLVAAAKRAKRGKKSTIVITEATLKQSGSGGHVTTTTNAMAPLVVPKEPLRPTPEMIARKNEEGRLQAEAAKAARAKKVEDAKKERVEATKYSDEQDGFDDEQVDPTLRDRPEESKPPQL